MLSALFANIYLLIWYCFRKRHFFPWGKKKWIHWLMHLESPEFSRALFQQHTVFFKDLFMFLVATLCFSCLPSGWLSMQWQCSFSNFRVHICILHYSDNDSVLVSQENLSLPSNCSKLNSSTIPAQNLWLRRHLTAVKIYSWAGINSFPNTFMPTKKNG